MSNPEQPPKRRRGRPAIPPEAQRKRLLDAAERAFERDHYERTSVQDVAREELLALHPRLLGAVRSLFPRFLR